MQSAARARPSAAFLPQRLLIEANIAITFDTLRALTSRSGTCAMATGGASFATTRMPCAQQLVGGGGGDASGEMTVILRGIACRLARARVCPGVDRGRPGVGPECILGRLVGDLGSTWADLRSDWADLGMV